MVRRAPAKRENGGMENQVAVVTGGTRGIGRAIAERLLSEGLKVAICGRTQEGVDSALAELRGHGESVFGVAADVAKLADVQRFFSAVNSRWGGFDVLVNNAGIGFFRSVADLTPEEWHQMIDLNLSGVYYCCHEAMPNFRKRDGGYVINISSLAAKNPFAGGSGYNASKFGLNGFAEAMMLDHQQENVRVTSIMPGSVDTEFGNGTPGAAWKIAPADIAEMVVALLRMPQRTLVSRVEMRPSRPPK